MKKYVFTVSVILLSCGCSSENDEIIKIKPPETNKAPSVPSLVYPTNNLLCIDNVLEFKWNASTDSNGDNITYTIEISKSNQFSSIDFTSTVSSITKTFTLEKGIAYYWRVKAMDGKNATCNYSSIHNLYTEGVGESNNLPFSPELISPDLGSSGEAGTITLSWSASDTDGDALKYDVYFDTITPPIALVSENQITITFDVSTSASTKYYWKIVARDNKKGESISQIWNFKTN